jgi:hypothetical protein
MPKLRGCLRGMARSPNEDVEPRVQQLFVGLCLERDIWSKDLASAGLFVCLDHHLFYA